MVLCGCSSAEQIELWRAARYVIPAESVSRRKATATKHAIDKYLKKGPSILNPNLGAA